MQKKLILLSIGITLLNLAWCWNNQNQQQISQQTKQIITDESKPLINVEEKTKESEKILKKIWLSWEKLEKELAKQKAWWEIISKLKWEQRKKYIIETKILPEIIKSWKVSKKCTTTNLNNYVACLYVTKTPIEKLLNEVPKEVQDTIKKTYYYKIYSLDRANLLKTTNDPIAIQEKKNQIEYMFNNWLITKPWVCDKLPEQETKAYCKSLFKNIQK